MGIPSMPSAAEAFLPLDLLASALLPLLLLKDGVGWLFLQLMGNHQPSQEEEMAISGGRICRVEPRCCGDDGCCSVCLAGFESGEEVSRTVACSHCFHRACLDRWLLHHNHSTCPLCRASL